MMNEPYLLSQDNQLLLEKAIQAAFSISSQNLFLSP
jgi:hypothetical protein